MKEEVEEIQVQPDSPLCRLQNSDQVALPPLQYAENASEKFKKPSNPIKPVSRISIRRSLFQTDPNPINQQVGFIQKSEI